MYELYVEKCKNEGCEEFLVKKSYYSEVFNTEFNIDFHKPKSDRCDQCEMYKVAERERILTAEMGVDRDRHNSEKEAMRVERNLDREDKNKLVISFDLENVINCPRANISSFFYNRKLSLYNLTAHDSLKRQGYCSIWLESTSGRSGNDLASAFISILKNVVSEHPGVSEITTWSDSCVPQNRNSIMSVAILKFMDDNPQINKITMKFSSPGHGAVQEVDNIHSNIEKVMKIAEFYSPLSFLRILINANRHHPYKTIQMRPEHFKNYHSCGVSMNFKDVPFTRVTTLCFKKGSTLIDFKTSFTEKQYKSVDVGPTVLTRRRQKISNFSIPEPKLLGDSAKALSEPKKKDLISMMKFMPLLDRQFFETLLKKNTKGT